MPIPKVRVKGSLADRAKTKAMDLTYELAKTVESAKAAANEGIAGIARDGALGNAIADIVRRNNDVENPAKGDPYKAR